MRLEPVTVELLRNYFQGVVDAMAHVVERTAHTTFVKETGDFTTGLLTPAGEFFAYPVDAGVSVFVGINYAKTIAAVERWDEGDVLLTNDPYSTNAAVTHLPDLHVLKPIFWQGRLVCFAYAFLHCSDIGGMVAASVSPRATEIFQEGLRIPPKKLYRAGALNDDLLDLILANCRIPEQNWGDLKALVAGLNSGERRVHELIGKFGLPTVEAGMADLLEYAEGKVRAVIRRMPPGRYTFSDFVEDAGTDIPIRLKVTVVVEGDGILLDFTGTDAQVSSAMNLPTAGQLHPFLALALINYFMSTDPTIPLNGGVIRPVRVHVPVGTVVNPQFPAACGVRYATVLRIYDTVLGALARAIPDHVPAASAGQGCMVALSLPDLRAGRRRVTVVEPMIGGGAARPNRDGINGCDAAHGYLRTTPVESLEAEVPIVVRRFDLIPGSAGPGRFRGGFAVRLDFQVFQPEGLVTARGMERLRFQPWGIHGGGAGVCGSVVVNPGAPGERPVGKIDALSLEPGDVLSVRSPGGGGYGDPYERDAPLVRDDVLDGLLSRAQAEAQYGVVLAGDEVDEEATKARRRARLTAARGGADFDFGAARREHEAVWSGEMYDAFIGILMELPPSYRPYVRRRLFERVTERARRAAVTPADVRAAWDELRARLDLAAEARR